MRWKGEEGGKKMIENPVNVFGGEKGIKLRESKKKIKNKEEEGQKTKRKKFSWLENLATRG